MDPDDPHNIRRRTAFPFQIPIYVRPPDLRWSDMVNLYLLI